MEVTLVYANREDMQTIWRMQILAFSDLLNKYLDYDINPGSESFEKVMEKFEQPWTVYYFISVADKYVGAMRIIDKKDGSRKRISPMWIMPEHRNKGYGQAAIVAIEKIYGSANWCLDTILQESGNIHLYEKMGYHRIGIVEKINNKMDIVFYEKN